MAYISELLGRSIADVEGERIGQLEDLIASLRGAPTMPHPVIVALVVKSGGGIRLIPFSSVAVPFAPVIPLKSRLKDCPPYEPNKDDLYLARDVLDKQIIDVNGVRVVRVNDLELTRVNGDVYVSNVDIGGVGLLRRLGLPKAAQRLAGRLGQGQPSIISWDHVELLPGEQSMRLKVPGDKLADLHPADLAEIISDLTRPETDKILQTLDAKMVADTLEEVEPDFQASLVETMPNEKVADVLEEMAPDEAADLLAEMPQDRSQELLKLMEHEEAEDVRELLKYPMNSAGGIMTTEYVIIPPDLTAAQALTFLRERAPTGAEIILYVYITDSDNHLIGVLSLSNLVLANPKTVVKDFMHRRVVCAKAQDSQEKVAQSIAKYNLLAVPVVDDQHHLLGIVTADDALDKIIPTAWKKHLPRLYR